MEVEGDEWVAQFDTRYNVESPLVKSRSNEPYDVKGQTQNFF